MKSVKTVLFFAVIATCIMYGASCSPKYGCPSNGKNVGAERILSGEKVPKAASLNRKYPGINLLNRPFNIFYNPKTVLYESHPTHRFWLH